MPQNSIGDTEQSGKRQSIGKRKLSDQGEPSQPRSQRTISEVLSQRDSDLQAHKRPRLSPSPSLFSPTQKIHTMYPISGSPPKNGAAPGRGLSGSNGPVRPQGLNAHTRQNNFSPHTGAKKLVVKNLRTGPRLNQESYFDKVWSQLDAALMAIFDGRKPESSLEELYKGGENVCRQERAALLAKKLQDRCREFVSGKMRMNLVTRAGGSTDVDTLRAVIEAWSAWHSKLVTVRWIFYYLDQSFLLHSKEQPVIREMGLIQFQSYIFSDTSLKPKILKGAYDLIEADRGGLTKELSDPSLLREAMELFHSLDVYGSDFEPLFMTKSEEFVKEWSQQQAAGSLAAYVENAYQLIEREVERCGLFSFNRSTKLKLSELLDETLVTQQTDVLTSEKEVLGLMRADNKTALKRLYGLLNRRDLSLQLKPAFRKYIIEEGEGIVFDQEREADMVIHLLQFKQKVHDIWVNAFESNEELGHTVREAFGAFMNRGKKMDSTGGTDNPKSGEMIAKYVDRLLKGGYKLPPGRNPEELSLMSDDAELDRQLDQVLDLFRFVHGKAVFEAFYKNDLARRLLMKRSASNDAEKSMLARLKNECGSNFTHNLESMFNDMDTANDEMTAFKRSLQEERKGRFEFEVNVLSAASWPTYPDVPVRIPSKIARSISKFETFYHNKHTGRKLTWKHQLAHCQLTANFPLGKKNLVVSSFQAIVLLLFNDIPDGESMQYAQIQEATGLSDPELQRTLQSLACAKYRVLSKTPKGKEVNSTDQFSYNTSFSDKQMRIKINQIQLKETKEETKTTHERVAADRHFETQAAIVRIMKSRKALSHAELIAEVINATKSRGVLQPTEIKGEIEKLIEKEYIERKEGTNQYSYVS
ncbi:Winged helix-turn-helix transcription repressor DNA-binding [Penicillium expansum]|uniref:Winged helix-turn-helix transcription repressor DNA-binding n=1 Tax=Penicillium expansum TaxID=27334 RepID=A0A0A2JRV9_PENEN|nr:Winged helix-turn-helix transcription repressor DNA-binding [Penicillium expansum]KGO41915.1 Winged helix-turn-helix transcription repressor DNA-binding [Penicillium expansum]KGO56632.1 Winged helix-turn-helix transcription repressor DNA-binding [Penicillium expansum]KGO58124.1 Winged helix-turn-helix transcription repressor DNA-binding [Penicillium expansum]